MIDLDSACKICWRCGLVQGKTAQLNRGMADRANGLEIAMQDGRVNRRSVASVIKRRRPRRSSGF
jgi:hypothetical protein